MIMKNTLFNVMLLLFLAGGTSAESNDSGVLQSEFPNIVDPDQLLEVLSTEKPSVIISQVESGILSGNIQSFSKYLAKQVFVNLRGNESGYFSSNQALYLLRSFFETRRVLRFKFTTIDESQEPFATGGGIFVLKGTKESVQIYVGLSKLDNRWVVTQFNVY